MHQVSLQPATFKSIERFATFCGSTVDQAINAIAADWMEYRGEDIIFESKRPSARKSKVIEFPGRC